MPPSTELFARIDRPRRLPDEIAQNIFAAIESGGLQPGDRLPTEQSLSKQFGVARTVIREAISLLKHDGVIRARQGVGAFVNETFDRSAFRISAACFQKRQQLMQLLQLRTGVQADAAALAAVERSADQLATMHEWLTQMSQAMQTGQEALEQRLNAESAFYRVVNEASGNDYYVQFIGIIEARIDENLRSVALKNVKASEWGDKIVAEHSRVFEAVRDQNADAARQAARAHFENAATRLADRADFADV